MLLDSLSGNRAHRGVTTVKSVKQKLKQVLSSGNGDSKTKAVKLI